MRRQCWLIGMLVVVGCLWSTYEQILQVHLEVLSGMVDKVLAKAETGRRPTPNDITELLYPLERARQFTHQYRKQSERPSYETFTALLDDYEKLAKQVDVARVSAEDWDALSRRLPEVVSAWHASAAKVEASLEGEG